jgi:hypothetical protein
MKYSARITTALGVAATVALGATLIAAVAQDGPDQNHPRGPNGRPGIERPSRENRRSGERPVTQQRRELSGTGADCTHTSAGLTPLTELGRATYKGFDGGLYHGGENVPPSEHESAGESLAKGIEPLSTSGEPDPDGRYVLLSIGMSNAQTEFTDFKQVTESDPDKDPRLVVVNGAQGGVASPEWSNPSDPAWRRVDEQLASSGVTPEQVAVAWVKVADQIRAFEHPSFPQHARDLESDMAAVAHILKDRYPNIRLAYYSSRLYGGYGSDNTEPYAYESGFSVKWLVDAQIEGSSDLNFDSHAGPVEVPWIGWGPYLWADGVVRRNDGLSWECSDFVQDGTHPSRTGTAKVANLLLDFVHTDPSAAQWYLTDP